jgi:hypothetical protein
MDNVVNTKRLADNSIDKGEKLRTSIYLKKEAYLKIDSLIKLSGSNPSRNDIIERAIDFYFAYSTAQLSQDFLCGVFGSKMEGLFGSLAARISKGNFRTAVEMNMLTRLLATEVAVGKTEYEKLRVKSLHDVKQTNGSVNIMDAMNDAEEDVPN